ncbi:MAG TPA: AMP-binding protein, partial [Syntrophales bacterium]
MNLIATLESNTRKNPDKDCLRVGGKGYSFRTVKEMSVQAAGLFQSLGLSKGDRVAIMSQNTVSFIVALYGTL